MKAIKVGCEQHGNFTSLDQGRVTVAEKTLRMGASTLQVTAEDPVMGFNIFGFMKGIPEITRCQKGVDTDSNVQRISVSISVICIIIDEDVREAPGKFSLYRRLPPKPDNLLILVQAQLMIPSRILSVLLLEICQDGRNIPS